ncbi:MAG: response regulator transcription factor [Candidatus Kapabacteria bacterium]|jgi:DNA-binding NarL/FixJ family response regulator|nr:response regulator transcription factor [Candidatus Kapabacteria bacterium]
MHNIRVVMVDDHRLFALAMQSLFSEADGVRIEAVAGHPSEVEGMIETLAPDIVMTDFSMPDINGAELCSRLSKRFPGIKILCLTMHREAHFIRKMLEAGASGYILKTATKEELLTAFRTLMQGAQYFSPEVTTALAGINTPKHSLETVQILDSLSKREREIIRLIALELTTQEIADKLFISVRTVDSHRQSILEKIGVRNAAGITRFAVEQGLV